MGKTGLERVEKGIFAPYRTGNPFSFPLFGAKKKIEVTSPLNPLSTREGEKGDDWG